MNKTSKLLYETDFQGHVCLVTIQFANILKQTCSTRVSVLSLLSAVWFTSFVMFWMCKCYEASRPYSVIVFSSEWLQQTLGWETWLTLITSYPNDPGKTISSHPETLTMYTLTACFIRKMVVNWKKKWTKP